MGSRLPETLSLLGVPPVSSRAATIAISAVAAVLLVAVLKKVDPAGVATKLGL